jgi:hypothetical protein
MDETLKNDIIIKTIRILDIGYITILFFTIGIIASTILDIMHDLLFTKKHKKRLISVIFEIIIMIILTGIVAHTCKNILDIIPSPLTRYYNNNYNIQELISISSFIILLFILEKNLKKNIHRFNFFRYKI